MAWTEITRPQSVGEITKRARATGLVSDFGAIM
jgi:hypothetical protein